MDIHNVVEVEQFKDDVVIYSVKSFSSYDAALADLKERYDELTNGDLGKIKSATIDLDTGYFSVETFLTDSLTIFNRKIGQIETTTLIKKMK